MHDVQLVIQEMNCAEKLRKPQFQVLIFVDQVFFLVGNFMKRDSLDHFENMPVLPSFSFLGYVDYLVNVRTFAQLFLHAFSADCSFPVFLKLLKFRCEFFDCEVFVAVRMALQIRDNVITENTLY